MFTKYRWLYIGLIVIAGAGAIFFGVIRVTSGNKGAGYVGVVLFSVVTISNLMLLIRNARHGSVFPPTKGSPNSD